MKKVTFASTKASDLIHQLGASLANDGNSQAAESRNPASRAVDHVDHGPSASGSPVLDTRPSTGLRPPPSTRPIVRAVCKSDAEVAHPELAPYQRIRLIEKVAIKETCELLLQTLPPRFRGNTGLAARQQVARAEEMLAGKLTQLADVERQLFTEFIAKQQAKTYWDGAKGAYLHFRSQSDTILRPPFYRYGESAAGDAVDKDIKKLLRKLKKRYGNVTIEGSNKHDKVEILKNGNIELHYTPEMKIVLGDVSDETPRSATTSDIIRETSAAIHAEADSFETANTAGDGPQVRMVRTHPVWGASEIRPFERIRLLEKMAVKETHEQVLQTLPARLTFHSELRVMRQVASAKETLKLQLKAIADLEAQLFAKYFAEKRLKDPSLTAKSAYSSFSVYRYYHPGINDVESDVQRLVREIKKYYRDFTIAGNNAEKKLNTLQDGTYTIDYASEIDVRLEGLRRSSPSRSKHRDGVDLRPLEPLWVTRFLAEHS